MPSWYSAGLDCYSTSSLGQIVLLFVLSSANVTYLYSIQLHERLQVAPGIKAIRPSASSLPHSLPAHRPCPMRLAECSCPLRERNRVLAHVSGLRVRLGITIRPSSGKNDPRSCHKSAVPMVGLDVDLEYRRCS